MVYGVLADTRAPLTFSQLTALRRAFKGADAILHAGPVGDLRVLDQLKTLAPVRAVCGNSEEAVVRSEIYVSQAWKVGPIGVGLVHGYGKPVGLKSFLLNQFRDNPVQVIVYGRNYEPIAQSIGECFFFNPGSFCGALPEGNHGKKGPARVGWLLVQGKKVEGGWSLLDP